MSADWIEIRRLKVRAQVGVPDEELAEAQTLLLSVEMEPREDFGGLNDEIERTVDYHAVSLEIQEIADERPRRLIETLAVEVAERLLDRHGLKRVRVSVEKFILPLTECVAVHVTRTR